MKKKNKDSYTKIIDRTIKISSKKGNGILKFSLTTDSKGKVYRYSLTYINLSLCSVDNGRVLGFDNCHGYHHRHYMGKEEDIHFTSYEELAECFEKEWRALHEKAKKQNKR